MKDNFLTIAVGLLLIIIIGLLAYQFILRSDPNKISLPLVEDCSLHLQACSATLPNGGKIFFEINPKQPNPTEVLYLTATFQQIEPQLVQVSFKGKTMNMGYLEYVKYALQRLDTSDESIQFSGKGGLSVCISGLMEWIVLVNVKADGATYELPFEFETIYNYN